MKKLLLLLSSELLFLFKDNLFRITNSISSDSFDGDSFIELESNTLKIRIISDRGQLFLDIQSKIEKKNDWYSIDLLRYLIEDIEILEDNLLDSNLELVENLFFIKNKFSLILDIFQKKSVNNTLRLLSDIRKKRSKVMFS